MSRRHLIINLQSRSLKLAAWNIFPLLHLGLKSFLAMRMQELLFFLVFEQSWPPWFISENQSSVSSMLSPISSKQQVINISEDDPLKEDNGQFLRERSFEQGIIGLSDESPNICTPSPDFMAGTELGIDPTRFYAVSSVKTSYPLIKKRSEIFQVFHRQDSAFVYFDEIIGRRSLAETDSSPLKVYSFESVKSGQRKFLVADYSTFIQRYLPTSSNKIDSQHKSSGSAPFPVACSEFNTRGVGGDDNRMHEKSHTHVYEIIRDNVPCRAYFDLEYEKAFNSNVDGDHLTSLWINLVVWKIFELYDIVLGKKDIVVLDSSTPKKYSKHVILIIPKCECTKNGDTLLVNFLSPSGSDKVGDSSGGTRTSEEYLFRNNITVGSLVCLIISDITDKEENSLATSHADILDQSSLKADGMHTVEETDRNDDVNKSTLLDSDGQGEFHRGFPIDSDSSMPPNSIMQGYEELWVKKENGKVTCFVDLGVYTRNRAFRLWNSSKYGKNAPFQVLFTDRKKYLGLSNSTMKIEREKSSDLSGNKRVRNMSALEELQNYTLKRSFVVPYNLYEGVLRKKISSGSSDSNSYSSSSSDKIGFGNVGIAVTASEVRTEDNQKDDVIKDLNDQLNSSSMDTTNNSPTYTQTDRDTSNNLMSDTVAVGSDDIEHSVNSHGLSEVQVHPQHSQSGVVTVSSAAVEPSLADSHHSPDTATSVHHLPDIGPAKAITFTRDLTAISSTFPPDNTSLVHPPSASSSPLSLSQSQSVPQSCNSSLEFPSSLLTHPQPLSLPLPLLLSTEQNIFDNPEPQMQYNQFLHLPIMARMTSVGIKKNSDFEFQTQPSNISDDPLFWRRNEILRSTIYGEKTPFLRVDDFVLKYVSKGGVQGLIGE
jgi:hypothetical protein